MPNRNHDGDQLTSRLKHLVAEMFRMDVAEPDTISEHAPLLGDGLGLDSLDALELALCMEEEFGLSLQSREQWHRAFASIRSLASFIRGQTQPQPVQRHTATAGEIARQALPAFAAS